MSTKETRPDYSGKHKQAYQRNRKIILATQDYCGICGKLVDKSLPQSDPMSATVDHIIPVNAAGGGGHPSSLDNLQLAHRCCNQSKGAKIPNGYHKAPQQPKTISNRVLPHLIDWGTYKATT